MSRLKELNRTKLTDLARQDDRKLDLVVELDYFGNIDVESKYLQVSIIPWLIGQVKLVEVEKRVRAVSLEINVKRNLFNIYSKINYHSEESSSMSEIISHRLTEIFKLTSLPSDPQFFGYFYRKNNTSFNYYTFHVFHSNKSNLSRVITDFQTQALKMHDNFLYEKLFDFNLIAKMRIPQSELNIPNFIELCLEKVNNASTVSKDNRVLLKFGATKLFIQEMDQEPVEQEYKNVLYLNNSITNENFFCLAYSSSPSKTTLASKMSINKNVVNALILFSKNVELIDNVIREYAINVSSELNNTLSSTSATLDRKSSLTSTADLNEVKNQQHTCVYCPMQQFVNLCEYLNKFDTGNRSPELIYDLIIDKLNYNLDLVDQNYLFNLIDEFKFEIKFSGNSTANGSTDNSNLNDINLFIMALIHKLCLKKQNQHLIDVYNGKAGNGGSFNLMLIKQSASSNLSAPTNSKVLLRSNTIDSSGVAAQSRHTNITGKSNSRLMSKLKMRSHRDCPHPLTSRVRAMAGDRSSIRRAIFNKIVAGGCNMNCMSTNDLNNSKNKSSTRFKNKQDIRQLWKKLISEQIILNKMAKENNRLVLEGRQADFEENGGDVTAEAMSNYMEITPCLKEMDIVWDDLLSQETCENEKEILGLVLRGVPQAKRKQVWLWLMKTTSKRPAGSEADLFLTTFENLVTQSTIHQHAILLDLGRTYPTHPNFARRFGRGQHALFNVLKAYSILDAEVGYCQGMSFIVGLLLMHVDNDEEKAFNLLKFLFVNLNFRQQYRPDMVQLQKYMYQFTRLLEVRLPEIYNHFEYYDVTSSLYAAPWFLTLYSSQFQIGFVARVFDFLFAEGALALFKISLAILSVHKPIILSCDSFESIVNHLKQAIPEMSLIESELIISKAYSTASNNLNENLVNDLRVYEIEFSLLYEEYLASVVSSLNHSAQISPRNIANTSRPSLDKDLDFVIVPANLGYSSSSSPPLSYEQLKVENERLRKDIHDLRENVHSLQMQLFNSDEQFFKMFNENKQIKCRIEVLEIERASFLRKLKDQEKMIDAYEKS